MPDALAHYAVSYLVASRVTKHKYALFIALIGLLPDIDVLLRVHRWVTHSIVSVALVASATAVILLHTRQNYLKYLALSITLYTLHIVLDTFIAPTPLLWPLTNKAYMLQAGIDGIIATNSIDITPQINIVVEQANFTPRPTIEGPIISPIGLIIAVGVIVVLLTEYLAKTMRR